MIECVRCLEIEALSYCAVAVADKLRTMDTRYTFKGAGHCLCLNLLARGKTAADGLLLGSWLQKLPSSWLASL